MIFFNRKDVAAQLMEHLQVYWQHTGVVLALPRGGVPLGQYIANHLQWLRCSDRQENRASPPS